MTTHGCVYIMYPLLPLFLRILPPTRKRILPTDWATSESHQPTHRVITRVDIERFFFSGDSRYSQSGAAPRHTCGRLRRRLGLPWRLKRMGTRQVEVVVRSSTFGVSKSTPQARMTNPTSQHQAFSQLLLCLLCPGRGRWQPLRRPYP